MCNFAKEIEKNNNDKIFMKKILLVIAALSLLTQGHVQAQTLRKATLFVTASSKKQYIDGFGGTGMNGQWGDVYTQEKVKKLWGKGEGCIGLNIMRIRINPNEGNWGEYGNPVKWARAINPDLQVFATPWTPPKKYKTQNTTKYQNDYGTWVWPLVEHSWGGEGSNGAAINPECYEAYADFLERYRATMESKGCSIDMISIQNESDYTPTATDNGVEHASYESCIYSPKEMAAMVKAARAAVDPKCKIMGPECFGWGQHDYNNALVKMSDAVNNIDVWGNHLYGTNDWSFVESVTKKTKKHMWMTEFLIELNEKGYSNVNSDYYSLSGKSYGGEFATEYKMIKSIEDAMKAGYSAYVYYNMLDDFFACNHGGSATELWKRAYVFGHYAKYATGKTRVQSTLSDSNGKLLGGTAYINETADTVTVFMLNRSATDNYQLSVELPFKPQQIIQMATNDNVNGYVLDVTDKYVNETLVYASGIIRARVMLLPGTFYTFQFVKNAPEETEEELATSAKLPANANPLLADKFMADPTSVEYDGRLYVYATNDQQQFDFCDGMQVNNFSNINTLRCISTDDLVNWIDHGIIDVKAIAPWIATSWAPSVVSRVEGDGLTHFYLYFTNSASGIGVLTSTSPTGPWTDPLGHALIDGNTEGLGTISNIIDPGVAINDDGTEAYLTFGGGDVTGTDLQPGNARIVKLGDDMISLASDIVPISAPCHFEANELNYINGLWYYSYCTRWSIASNWASYSSKTKPRAASIVYMTSSYPLDDRWTYQGEIVPNPGTLGYPYGTNHSRLQKYEGTYYILYHTQWLEKQLGFNGGYRNLQMARTRIRNNNITALTSSSASIEGLAQPLDKRVNPYVEQDGDLAAIMTKNWWMVRGVNFASTTDGPARSLILKVRGSGTVSVCSNTVVGEPIAKAEFTAPEESGEAKAIGTRRLVESADDEGVQTVIVPLDVERKGFYNYLYFVKTGNAEVISWRFTNLTAEEATGIEAIAADGNDGSNDGSATAADLNAPWFTVNGTRLTGRPATKGIYIHGQRKVVIK